MPRLCTSLLRIPVLLVVVQTAWADLSLVDDKLALDVEVWTAAHWWRAEREGLLQSEFAFERVGALAGLTGQMSPVVSLRVSGDVGVLQPQDLYVDLRWRSGLGLRAGQFLPPIGVDATTEPDSVKMAINSLLVPYAKPAGTRDIGAMGGWETRRFSLTAAVVNGTGANAGDNNGRKDLCGRLAVRPSAAVDAVVALRVYYGWPDALDSLWRTAAVEARLRHGPLELQAEFQSHHSQYARNNVAYLQAVWDIGLLEPVGRFDLVLPQGERIAFRMVGGLNLRPIADGLRLMLGCYYHRQNQVGWEGLGLHFRLQAVI